MGKHLTKLFSKLISFSLCFLNSKGTKLEFDNPEPGFGNSRDLATFNFPVSCFFLTKRSGFVSKYPHDTCM